MTGKCKFAPQSDLRLGRRHFTRCKRRPRGAPVQGDGRHSDGGAQLAGRVLADAAGRGRAGRRRLAIGRRRRRIAIQLQALAQLLPPLRSNPATS